MAINTPSMAKYNGLMSVRRSDKILSKYMFRENKMSGRKTVRKGKEENQKTGGKSVIMQETARYGVGTTFRYHKLTEEDKKYAAEMDKKIIQEQDAVIDWSYEK